jgi:hypothetical protein
MLYLLDLALRGGGYEYRGVRGWAAHEDVGIGTDRRLGDVLSRLSLMGIFAREDLRHPGRGLGSWIYRIAERGLASLAAVEGLNSPAIEWPGDPPATGETKRVYVPAGALLALRALRLVAANPTPSRLLPNEGGWRTLAELVELGCPTHEEEPEWKLDMLIGDLDELDDPAPWRGEREPWKPTRPRYFFNGDMVWLVRAGLAQRFGTIPEFGRRHSVVYRLTPLGAEVEPLEWNEPIPESGGDGA